MKKKRKSKDIDKKNLRSAVNNKILWKKFSLDEFINKNLETTRIFRRILTSNDLKTKMYCLFIHTSPVSEKENRIPRARNRFMNSCENMALFNETHYNGWKHQRHKNKYCFKKCLQLRKTLIMFIIAKYQLT